VPPGDARALREAIATIVDGAALCGQLGRTGYEIARARFDAERNGQRILDLVAAVAHPAATRSVA
jgi:glycosyltransferase involved in cell wall biosynthesis